MNKKSSRLPIFYKKSRDERLSLLQAFAGLAERDITLLKQSNVLDFAAANNMIENVVSMMPIPFGIATNFIINNKDYLIPMVVEEASVVAASCNAARLTRESGGFFAESSPPIMMGQVLLMQVPDIAAAITKIQHHKQELIEHANKRDPFLVQLGGGVIDIECVQRESSRGSMLVVQLLVDVKDAMGANIVNNMAECIALRLEKISGGQARLKIVANLATKRLARARAVWPKKLLGQALIEAILDADAFAQVDQHRATTHNKGIMNGIDAVALATGNDFRALEAGVHSFAVRNGIYQPVTRYEKNEAGDLVGYFEAPLAVGIVGGIIKSHPLAQVALNILGVKSAQELAQVMAAVGLAQNFGALRALVTEGIQKGHMRLHSRNIAIQAGAVGYAIEVVAQAMITENNICVRRAKELVKTQERAV